MLARTTDCGACRTLRTKLEAARDHLYQTLETVGMDHSHPEVLKASVAFDELLNAYLRHLNAHESRHESRSVAFRPSTSHAPHGRLEVAGR